MSEDLVMQRAQEIYEEHRRPGWDPSWVNASWHDRQEAERQARKEMEDD